MPDRRKLTDAGIARLRPGAREYTVWDTQVAGLGVRVRPSGSRTFIYNRRTEGGVHKMSFGPAALSGVAEVRRACLETATGAGGADTARLGKAPLFREFVAGQWKAERFERCKPSTRKGYRSMLDRQLLPAFGSRRLDRISRGMALGWFEACSRTAPGSANHALALLRQILNHAVACGHIAANPVRGISPDFSPGVGASGLCM